MSIPEENIKILNKLGLSRQEAEVYLVLSMYGRGKVSAILKGADMDRSNIYQAISTLQKKGLVTKIVGKPNEYEAMPMKSAISMLIETRENEQKHIYKEAQRLSKQLTNTKFLQRGSFTFQMLGGGKEKKVKGAQQTTQTVNESLDLIFNAKRFREVFSEIIKSHVDCAKRGVKIRIIIESIKPIQIQNNLKGILDEPNCEIRCILFTPKTDIVISDKKSAMFSLFPNLGARGNSSILTDHPFCVEMIQKYFDELWSQALKINQIENPSISQTTVTK